MTIMIQKILLACLVLTTSGLHAQTDEDMLFPRKVVVEEGSGTWCQYCVRGIVGMKKMQERYPDTFIGIVSHSNDPMETASYNMLHSQFFSSGLPNCVMNRKKTLVLDPSFELLEEAYLQECAPTNVGIQIEASFTTEATEEISMTATTTFGFSQEDAAFRIAFVLIENDVTGTDSKYAQANAYSKYCGSEVAGMPMDGFEELPYLVPAEDMAYENVARGIYKSYLGTLNSIPTIVEKGTEYKYSYLIDKATLQNANISQKKQLEAIVLLIDSHTGEIVNADKAKVSTPSTNGIKKSGTTFPVVRVSHYRISVEGTHEEPHVFTLDGREVPNKNLPKGVYLIEAIHDGHRFVQKVRVD